MARRWNSKKRSRPVKSTSTFKKGQRNAWLTGGVVVALALAMFPKAYNEIFKRTPTVGA